MIYFKDITNIEQAKLHYRKLAKQLHPDTGGTSQEFQKMQDEYKTTIEAIQKYSNLVNYHSHPSPEKEFLGQLGKLAQLLIKKQVPQEYLRQKIKTTNSNLNKDLLEGVVNFLDGL
ncbi:J domain-containing protein [Geofilum rhodophaeum]|jgi:DnaJ-domain-containing protein 1|uniref:hypothetical protein n=1 Tax=Geofilum rhodophaeum TaxID=1965019 RepID=UPI000B51F8D1|nr:hypothetical protein [Geofilum rhodophaeum]